jgi:hypothetical protein
MHTEIYILAIIFTLIFCRYSDFTDIIDDNSESSSSIFCEMYQTQWIQGLFVVYGVPYI